MKNRKYVMIGEKKCRLSEGGSMLEYNGEIHVINQDEEKNEYVVIDGKERPVLSYKSAAGKPKGPKTVKPNFRIPESTYLLLIAKYGGDINRMFNDWCTNLVKGISHA